jgi:hypothetical protein
VSGRISLSGPRRLLGSFRNTVISVAEGASAAVDLRYSVNVVDVTTGTATSATVTLPNGVTAAADGYVVVFTRRAHSTFASADITITGADRFSTTLSDGSFASTASLTSAGSFLWLVYDSSVQRWVVTKHSATFA